MAKRWYVVHAYSGYEKKVMLALGERIALRKMEDYFDEVLVPTEEVVEMRGGQKRKSELQMVLLMTSPVRLKKLITRRVDCALLY
jgi:transcription antitermination factor NusG